MAKDNNADKVFTSWDDTHSALWGQQPIRLVHGLHKSPLFSTDRLAELIERYPREHYSLVQTGAKESRRLWKARSAISAAVR